jgi:hypothetical protein
MTAEEDRPGRLPLVPGYYIAYFDGVKTLVGTESGAREDPVVALTELRQRRHVQNTALLGLLLLLGQVLLLGVLAMVGVGSHWFEQGFAIEVLAITVTPSFTAWLMVVRWAFRLEASQRG